MLEVLGGILSAIKRSWIPSFSCPQAPLGPHHQEEPVSDPKPLTPEEKLADAKKLLSLPRIVVICGPHGAGAGRQPSVVPIPTREERR
ncbi:hypothetical protein AB0L71_08735 [Streptomyces sp. NPDC052052]|uniref:hypothetical protein n=1 Tax=Streptomyces sp. NPDC052052 TaxID=3154756 RepID=UPI0034160F2F